MPAGNPTTSGMAGNYSLAFTTDQVFALCREAGLGELFSRGIARRFSMFSPDNYDKLESILAESGVGKPARAYIAGGYRELTGSPAPAKPEPSAPAVRVEEESPVVRARKRAMEDLEMRQFAAEVAAAERRARGEGEEGSGVAAMRQELAALRQEINDRRMTDHLAHLVAPLRAEIDQLRGQATSRRSIDDVKTDTLAASVNLLAEEVRGRSHLLKQVGEHPDAAKMVLKTAQKLLTTPEERTELLLPPTPEQLGEFQRRVEAAEQAMGSEGAEGQGHGGLLLPVGHRPAPPETQGEP